MVELEKLFIHSGLIVESLKVTLSNQLEQIAIAFFVLGQQSEMMGSPMGWFSATAISLGGVDFAANDWFYTCFLSRYIEVNDAIHGTVVSDSQAVHARFLGAGDELRYAAHAIEQAVFGMDVKVGKLLWHWLDYSICAKSSRWRISDYRKFLYHHNEHRHLPALLPEPADGL
jgi:hypothetical protein